MSDYDHSDAVRMPDDEFNEFIDLFRSRQNFMDINLKILEGRMDKQGKTEENDEMFQCRLNEIASTLSSFENEFAEKVSDHYDLYTDQGMVIIGVLNENRKLATRMFDFTKTRDFGDEASDDMQDFLKFYRNLERDVLTAVLNAVDKEDRFEFEQQALHEQQHDTGGALWTFRQIIQENNTPVSQPSGPEF